jgi:hypothetical protein
MAIQISGTTVIDNSRALSSTAIDNLGPYRSNLISTGTTIDCSTGNYFTRNISSNTTFSFANVPSARAYAFTLRLIVSGDRTITWPSSVQFPGNTAPILNPGKVHLFIFVTDNGGTTFRGASLANYEA